MGNGLVSFLDEIGWGVVLDEGYGIGEGVSAFIVSIAWIGPLGNIHHPPASCIRNSGWRNITRKNSEMQMDIFRSTAPRTSFSDHISSAHIIIFWQTFL